LSNTHIDFATMQRLNRFAKYWGMIGNSGRFVRTLPLLLGDAPYSRFLAFSDWLFDTTGQTHRIALDRLYTLVFEGITKLFATDIAIARDMLSRDYFESGARGVPKFLIQTESNSSTAAAKVHVIAQRQARHRRDAAV
jgi:hypothetical protein